MRKISTWILSLLLFPMTMYGQTWSGEGTASSPYQISSAADLQALADEVKNGTDFSGEYFAVQQDISGISSVIGSVETPFKGIFDGNNHTLTVNISASGYIGLFGYIQDATIKRVKLAGIVNGDSDADGGHGGLVGYSKNGIVENCHNSATLNCAYKRNGGIVGYNEYGTIRYCTNSGSVLGTVESGDRTGGICGYNEGGTIMNCSNSGKVFGDDGIGGIVGRNSDGGSVRSCSNSGTVSGDFSIGGIVGEFYSEPFRASTTSEIVYGYNEGEITGSDGVAGIVGEVDNGLIQFCYNVGAITCTDDEGIAYGIAYTYSSTTMLENCNYLKGTVSGSDEGVSAEDLVKEMATVFTPENGWASAPSLGADGEITSPTLAMESEEEVPPTSIEEITGVQVYAKDGSIFVQTPQQEQVMIISMSGTIIKNESQIGLKQYTGLRQGIYIICIGEERVKVVI